jgi:hypothetical protein
VDVSYLVIVMPRAAILALAVLAVGAASPALAGGHRFDFSPALPASDHQMDLRDADSAKPAYAMSYSDEAAQSLGVAGGKWEAFDTGHSSSEPFLPSLHGGVDSGAAMIKLQWR